MEKLLLHSCCGPCSTAVIDALKNDYDITIYYYNPNIDTNEEFLHRLNEEKRYCLAHNISVIDDGYFHEEFLSKVKGLEKEKEGGARCAVCFRLRMEKTALKAKELGINLFDTTLSVSPHKNSAVILAVGEAVEKETGVKFLGGNYKKKDGYKKSIILSKEFGLYRQNYCGCEFAKGHLNKE